MMHSRDEREITEVSSYEIINQNVFESATRYEKTNRLDSSETLRMNKIVVYNWQSYFPFSIQSSSFYTIKTLLIHSGEYEGGERGSFLRASMLILQFRSLFNITKASSTLFIDVVEKENCMENTNRTSFLFPHRRVDTEVSSYMHNRLEDVDGVGKNVSTETFQSKLCKKLYRAKINDKVFRLPMLFHFFTLQMKMSEIYICWVNCNFEDIQDIKVLNSHRIFHVVYVMFTWILK